MFDVAHFKESRRRSLWSLQITITLTDDAFYRNQGVEKCCHGLSIEPATLDLGSQSGSFD